MKIYKVFLPFLIVLLLSCQSNETAHSECNRIIDSLKNQNRVLADDANVQRQMQSIEARKAMQAFKELQAVKKELNALKAESKK